MVQGLDGGEELWGRITPRSSVVSVSVHDPQKQIKPYLNNLSKFS